MKKVITEKTIYFYDDENHEIMYIDYSTDECIWYFYSNDVITINKDMEFYNILDNFMNEKYLFSEELLPDYRDYNRLTWYSDCYYNPDDEWSIANVSCLNIQRNKDEFKIWCTKKLDEIIDRPHKSYGICFSTLENGKYSKNLKTGLTLQDDFVIMVYQQLLNKNKSLNKLK